MKNKTRYKDFSRNDDAVVGIVVAILLVGLLVTVFSIVQTVQVPQWMEEIESDHMDTVASQFVELKHTIDIQLYAPSYYNNIPVTTPITLGSGNVPYFLSQKSSGNIQIKNDTFQIEIDGDTDKSYSIGTIEYTSSNSYFTDQKYIYEAGAMILSQSQGSLLVSKPFISAINNQSINISLTVVNIQNNVGKTSAHGSSTCSILTNYSSAQNQTITNMTKLTITTNYPNIWKESINTTLSSKGLIEGTDYSLSLSTEEIIFDFSSSSKKVNIQIDEIKINAQISPGWIR